MTEHQTRRGRQESTERRRRNSDTLAGKRRRLALNEAALDRENFVYYLARNDQVELLTTQDDWDVVQDRDGQIKMNSAGSGSEVAIPAGQGATGAPVRHVLLRKPKKYQDEDAAVAQRRTEEIEAGMRKSAITGTRPDEGMQFETDTVSAPRRRA